MKITSSHWQNTLEFKEKIGYNDKVLCAGVMELVDVVDSKSTAGDSVPVRVRSPAPNRVFITNLNVGVNTRFLFSGFLGARDFALQVLAIGDGGGIYFCCDSQAPVEKLGVLWDTSGGIIQAREWANNGRREKQKGKVIRCLWKLLEAILPTCRWMPS